MYLDMVVPPGGILARISPEDGGQLLPSNKVVVFIDDILIMGNSFAEHFILYACNLCVVL